MRRFSATHDDYFFLLRPDIIPRTIRNGGVNHLVCWATALTPTSARRRPADTGGSTPTWLPGQDGPLTAADQPGAAQQASQ